MQQQGALRLSGQRMRYRSHLGLGFKLEFQGGFAQPQVIDRELCRLLCANAVS
jgi:hypothetical protein